MSWRDRNITFNAGFAAGKGMVPASHNPHPKRSLERRDWRRGWEQGVASTDFLMNAYPENESDHQLDKLDDFDGDIELNHSRKRHSDCDVLDCFDMMEAIDGYARR